MSDYRSLTHTLGEILIDLSLSNNIPGAMFSKVMEAPNLNGEYVAQLHRLAEHMGLCIRARDAWRGE